LLDGRSQSLRSDTAGCSRPDINKENLMNPSTDEGRTMVYKYGCPSWAKLDEAAEYQLRLAHELRNALVAIHRAHAETVAAIWAEHPEVAAREAELAVADAKLAEAIEAGKNERMHARTTKVSAATRQVIAAAKAARKKAKAAHKAAKDAAYDLLVPRFAAAKADRKAQEKATYGEFVQKRGLYWTTYNDVRRHFMTTVASVTKKRRAGQRADVRFHRWTGEGTLTIQLPRGAGDPVRSPDLLASGEGPWRYMVRLPAIDPEEWATLTPAERRVRARAEVAIRIGTKDGAPVWCEVPVVWHRPLPPDADVAQVQITRRFVAGKARLSVAVTVRIGAAPRTERTGAVALNLGWRSLGERGIRVAVWEATSVPAHPLVVPPHLEEVIKVKDGGRRGEVIIPASWRYVYDDCDALRSERDKKLDALRPQLVDWLKAQPAAAEVLGAPYADVLRWRSANRFAALAHRWREARKGGDEVVRAALVGDEAMYAALEAWRVHDKHHWSREANQRDQLIARRNDAYRVLASLLTSAFGLVIVDKSDLAQLARRPATEDPDEEQARKARGQRVLASPGLLRSFVVAAADREGVPVEHVEADLITVVHAPCGTNLAGRADFATTINVWCPACQRAFDQDCNAAANLLRRVVA